MQKQQAKTQDDTAEQPVGAANKLDWQAQKAKQAQLRKLQNELKKTEEEITRLEDEIAAIDEACALPENVTNSAKLNEFAAKQQACREQLERCYETWEELSMQLEQ